MRGRNEPCWCGSEKKWKKCCFPKQSPSSHASIRDEYRRKYQITLKTSEQIEGIRQAGHLAAKILEATAAEAKVGVSTEQLNQFAHELHLKHGAKPAPLHYGSPPFPKSICTSLNEVVCHGIPNDTPLKNGDILNIDVTCILNGYYGDCSRMVILGDISPEQQRVVDVSYESLMRSIELCKPGLPLYEIGDTITDYAEEHNCSVVYQFVAHGVGLRFHEAPQISHCRNHMNIPLAAGMTFTIEPMINAGVAEAIIDPVDNWVARTADGKPSAQWEHTLLITNDGYEILTPWTR